MHGDVRGYTGLWRGYTGLQKAMLLDVMIMPLTAP